MRGIVAGLVLMAALSLIVLSIRPGGLRRQLRLAARRLRLVLLLGGIYLILSGVIRIVFQEGWVADYGPTASAGNMAQGVAWNARRLGIRCSAVVPDGAPRSKLEAIHRLGAETISVPYDEWWNVLITHRYKPLEPAHFIHPVSDTAVMAGNGTIGLEIMEDLPNVNVVLAPYGGGGLSCGIATAVRSLKPEVRVYGCEVESAAPLAAALAAGGPVPFARKASFVDGIGSPIVLPEMWPAASHWLAGALVVSLADVAAAIAHLVRYAAIVAEGAGGAAVAAGLKGLAGPGRYVAVVSGGNIDADVLIPILDSELP